MLKKAKSITAVSAILVAAFCGNVALAGALSINNETKTSQSADEKLEFGNQYSTPKPDEIAGSLMRGLLQTGSLNIDGVISIARSRLHKGGMNSEQIALFMAEFRKQRERNKDYEASVGSMQAGLMSVGATVSSLGLYRDPEKHGLGIQAGLALIGQFDHAQEVGMEIKDFQLKRGALSGKVNGLTGGDTVTQPKASEAGSATANMNGASAIGKIGGKEDVQKGKSIDAVNAMLKRGEIDVAQQQKLIWVILNSD